jgi:hypothetical protein
MSAAQKFNGASAAAKKAASPFSLRLSEEERALLRQRAGKRSLGDYIRSQLFGRIARQSKRRTPRDMDIEYAKAVAALGRSEMARNLSMMAEAARIGALPVTPDLVATIEATCAKVHFACDALIASLGVKPK